MGKAEEKSQNRYPTLAEKYAFIDGYEQAEKDLDAEQVAEIAKEETIKEVCEWIKYNNENGGCLFDGWKNDLKKHLKKIQYEIEH